MEKAPKARIGDLDKKKYLVPSDLTGDETCLRFYPLALIIRCDFHIFVLFSKSSGPVLFPHPKTNPLKS